MLVVKYYDWNCKKDVFEVKVERCTEVFSKNNGTILCRRESSNELIDIHLDQLISIKPFTEESVPKMERRK